jgi:prevent-host-death family protein
MTGRRGAEEARNRLPELLEAAERGESTVITKRGRPVAVLAPVGAIGSVSAQQSLLSLAGTGRGLWGPDSTTTIRALRDEWNS